MKNIITAIVAATISASAESHLNHLAPIGVMGDHLHEKGKFMTSYRYRYMQMNENFDGTSAVSDATVRNNFAVSPTDMDMQMHMIGLMYAPTDNITFMAMVNLVELSMNHERRDGVKFKTTSSGLGDSSLGAFFRITNRLHGGLGVILPTAEVEETDFIPGPGETRLPYPMQLGAGSWGLMPSLTYRQFYSDWYWGSQVSGKIFLDDNSEGYRVGNRIEFTSWAVKPINENFSISARINFSDWGNIDGEDEDLLPLPVPTARTDLRGGSRLDLLVGVNIFDNHSGLNGGIEFGQTLWQDLDGPQLGSDWSLTAGIRYSF